MLKIVLRLLSSILLVFLFLAACSSEPDNAVKASIGQPFNLAIGQTAFISGENLMVKFDSVTSDSRCPKGVQCIRAGDAKCQTHLSFSNTTMTPAPFELVDAGGQFDGYSQATWVYNSGSSYKINFRLEPYPEAGKQIKSTDYKLVMIITR